MRDRVGYSYREEDLQQQRADASPEVGRTTLAERHAMAAGPMQPAFGDAQWEDIQEPALPEAEERELSSLPAATASAAQAKPPPSSPPAHAAQIQPPVDDPDAKQTIYSDQHKDPHAKRFQTKKKHAERHRAKRDRYNQADIRSDKPSKYIVARPGIVVKDKKRRSSVFTLERGKATRYLFIKRGNQNIAQPFDVVDGAKLARYNYKGVGKKSDNGKTTRLLLNPSQPRKLVIDGKAETCVLSWLGGETAAWIPVKELAGNTQKIVSAVKKRASDWAPHRVSNDPKKLLKKSKRYVIRNDAVGQEAKSDKGDVLAAGAKAGNNVSHYLNKERRKPGFGADGQPLGRNVTRSIVAICMNLPAGRTPPVAVDTAVAGDSFFVMRDKSFHRKTPVFENGKRTSSKLLHWVFGHLGMLDAQGNLVPDPARRGWVPLRVLAGAAHLTTTQV